MKQCKAQSAECKDKTGIVAEGDTCDASTHQRIRASTHQRINASTHQRFFR
jgi:murein endopeptidase